jgi:oligopeptidase B
MKGRIKADDSSVPKRDGPYAYYMRYRKDGQYPLLCREPRNGSPVPSTQTAEAKPQEQLLLDGDALAQGKAFFRLGAARHSSDHRLLAWLADESGSELYTARVREDRHRSRPRRRRARCIRRSGLDAGCLGLLLCAARPKP